MPTCAHEPCTCDVLPGDVVCGLRCSQADPNDPCTCGHPECAASIDAALATYGDSSTNPNADDTRAAHEGAPDDVI